MAKNKPPVLFSKRSFAVFGWEAFSAKIFSVLVSFFFLKKVNWTGFQCG